MRINVCLEKKCQDLNLGLVLSPDHVGRGENFDCLIPSDAGKIFAWSETSANHEQIKALTN